MSVKTRMKTEYDLLYIAFVDLDDESKSGSSVRPKKMLEAFKEEGLQIKVLHGWNNKRKERKKRVKEIIKWLDSNRPKVCYVEPPSGPFFCSKDLVLLMKLKRLGVPIGIFYRDAYWMFPETYGKSNAIDRVKHIVIRYMHKRDLWIFKRVCKCFFFPSMTMANLFKLNPDTLILPLPPGCIEGLACDKKVTTSSEDTLTYFYVGAASERYGTDMLLQSFEKLNANKVVAKLIAITPENQWLEMFGTAYDKFPWLQKVHTGDPEILRNLYGQADICIVPLRKNFYNDFAVPIKLFEYLSYEKPVLATNCTETGKFVLENDIGWVIQDNVEDMVLALQRLDSGREEFVIKQKNCSEVKNQNLWIERAKCVINTLSNIY